MTDRDEFYIIARVKGTRGQAGEIRRAIHETASAYGFIVADNLIGTDRTRDRYGPTDRRIHKAREAFQAVMYP